MAETLTSTEKWLDALGYTRATGTICRSVSDVKEDHPYARELKLMLSADGEISSTAVYEIDRVPAVCFVEHDDNRLLNSDFVDEVRRKIWNQNLVSIVVVICQEQATAYPAPKALSPAAPMKLKAAKVDGPFSAQEVDSGAIHARLPEWFDRKKRLDTVLLENLSYAVQLIKDHGHTLEEAQLLLGKCIFVSYLEDRGIVGDKYRAHHNVGELLDLLRRADASGLDRLFRRLKSDFNGDLLEIEGGANVDWRTLGQEVLDLLAQFLSQTHIRSGQKSLWPYDFKHVPVEIISGIYESFLGSVQRKQGAFYTPRHLASLAVEEAFRGIDEPWNEVVLDGACGSGILLTSAYRRMLGALVVHKQRALEYREREAVLLSGIRGGDTSRAACKVTAFSLYLMLLEDLSPSDIVLLQNDQDVKLPKLGGKVLSREGSGDFFDDSNVVAQRGKATIILSNPPWFEPDDEENHRYESWWKDTFKQKLPRRQIALAFARRASNLLAEHGRLCLILPASVLAAAVAGPFLLDWFHEIAPRRIFNLADMRFVLFDGAIHPTAIVSGVKRGASETRIPSNESFEYYVPKADVSLAFGRLTVHSFDRKTLHTHAACADAEKLRTYFWGTELDESLIARLRLDGRFEDHASGKNARFVICKGFHKTDSKKPALTSSPLQKTRFLSTAIGNSDYPKGSVFVTHNSLSDFPSDFKTVADYGSSGGQAFDGVRVIFPDGTDSDTLEVRACYADQPFCFTQTVGAIVDRKGDRSLMQFMAVYLRSKLARYLLFYTTFSLTMERPHVKLSEIRQLPFLLPEHHNDPELASEIIGRIVALLAPFRRLKDMAANPRWAEARDLIDQLVFDYFGLSITERKVVNNTCTFFIPSQQPSTLKALSRPLLEKPDATEFDEYKQIFRHELESWRDRLRGRGYFDVRVIRPRNVGAMSVVKIRITPEREKPAVELTDIPAPVIAMLNRLRGTDDYPRVGDDTLSLASDFLVYHEDDYYLVKPMIKRLWLAGAAAQDAYRIVQSVRNGGQGGN